MSHAHPSDIASRYKESLQNERFVGKMSFHIDNGGMDIEVLDYGYGPTLRLSYGHMGHFHCQRDFPLSRRTLFELSRICIRIAGEKEVTIEGMGPYETPHGSIKESGVVYGSDDYTMKSDDNDILRFGFDHDSRFGIFFETHQERWFMETEQTSVLKLGLMLFQSSQEEMSSPVDECLTFDEDGVNIISLDSKIDQAIDNVMEEQEERAIAMEKRKEFFENIGGIEWIRGDEKHNEMDGISNSNFIYYAHNPDEFVDHFLES